MTENRPDESFDELDLLIHVAVGKILKPTAPDDFLAWFADSGPHLAPGMAAQILGNARDKRAAFLNIGRQLWNRTPQPDHRFRPRPLPKPERNAPCPCGSGKKYKHCCAFTENLPDLFQDLSLLLYVLRYIPVGQYKDLPFSYLDPEELSYVAHTWREEGKARDAVKLLEPMLADPAKLDERAEMAFDTLIECYNDLGNPRKKTKLIEAFLHAPNRTLKSAALHRRIGIMSDAGDHEGAWRLFLDAQRLEPDNPNLALLEILLLQARGQLDQARDRGRFWIARLSRDRGHDYGDLIDAVRELMESPAEMHFKAAAEEMPDLDRLRALVERLPAPECHYRLCPEGDSAGPLEPGSSNGHPWRMIHPGDRRAPVCDTPAYPAGEAARA